jgi:uncharacterized protein (DUF1697 family)
MVYVALLRGVNVGGTGKIDTRELKTLFEAAGLSRVRTYINSGNVIFDSEHSDTRRLAESLEAAIELRFGFAVRVLVRERGQIRSMVAALPATWANNETMKCDVFFLWPEADSPSVLDQLDFDPAIDDVRYTPGAVLRCVQRQDAPKSRLTRIVGTPLHQQMTIRNCNTARRLLALMDE